MDAEIKKFADNKDLKSLKYIFVDSLDVDPTFVRYEEEYNYCKSIPGLLEPHIELTPFTQNQAAWNEAYWTNLKMDLVKNFSDKRMMHMREVAKVFLATKIKRILEERAASSRVAAAPVNSASRKVPQVDPAPNAQKTTPDPQNQTPSKAAEEERKIQEARARPEKENQDVEEAKIQADNIRKKQQYKNPVNKQISYNGADSKKFMGIVVAAVVVLVVIAILVLK